MPDTITSALATLALFTLWNMAGASVILVAVIMRPDRPWAIALPAFGVIWGFAFLAL